MKKALSLILVLMLSLAFVAMAETVSPADPIPGAFPITVEGEEGLMVYVDESEAAMADAEAQLAKLSELGAAEYFGADVGDKSLVALFPIGVDNFDIGITWRLDVISR